MSILRFLMLLSLVVWIGGIIFFAFGVAPTVFKVLPTRHLAGAVVTRSLGILHWMGIVSGVVFVGSSMAYTHGTHGVAEPFAPRHLVIYAMLVLTVVSQFVVSPQMLALRTQMVVIDDVPPTDARRIEFNRLHVWSTRLESAVLLLGLAALYMTARKI